MAPGNQMQDMGFIFSRRRSSHWMREKRRLTTNPGSASAAEFQAARAGSWRAWRKNHFEERSGGRFSSGFFGGVRVNRGFGWVFWLLFSFWLGSFGCWWDCSTILQKGCVLLCSFFFHQQNCKNETIASKYSAGNRQPLGGSMHGGGGG